MSLDEHLTQALDALAERLRDEVSRQVRSVGDELAAETRAWHVEKAPEESGATTARLAEGVRAIGAARTLTGILDALMDCAARESARACVLLVRGDRFQGWRFAGFGPKFGEGEHLEVPYADAGVVARAADLGTVAMGDESDRAAPAFAEPSAGQRCGAVPLTIGGQVVAVLYADSGAREEPGILNLEPLEILVRHAARCLEAVTAMKAAQWLADRDGSETTAPVAIDDREAADEYAAARRYAKLLVSEIKLYHEPQVAAGRRERDLATRLGGEIARVHALYEERVPANVRQNTDYVREELIRTLADGDASLLGVGGHS